jgi:hypothetical protein
MDILSAYTGAGFHFSYQNADRVVAYMYTLLQFVRLP